MVKLIAKSPLAGQEPLSIGSVTLAECPWSPIWMLSPGGDVATLGKALKSEHGVAWPGPGETDKEIRWFDLHHVVLFLDPGPKVQAACYAVDQSDAWCRVTVSGDGARDVLARLTPLDLRASAFAVGQTARSDVQHMAGSVTRIGADSYEVMVFRSMAGTLWHDLARAAQAVSARISGFALDS